MMMKQKNCSHVNGIRYCSHSPVVCAHFIPFRWCSKLPAMQRRHREYTAQITYSLTCKATHVIVWTVAAHGDNGKPFPTTKQSTSRILQWRDFSEVGKRSGMHLSITLLLALDQHSTQYLSSSLHSCSRANPISVLCVSAFCSNFRLCTRFRISNAIRCAHFVFCFSIGRRVGIAGV